MSDILEIVKCTAARACLGNVYIHTQKNAAFNGHNGMCLSGANVRTTSQIQLSVVRVRM